MRLLAHNMLACNAKGVTNGYPLRIVATKTETNESEFNGPFIVHMLGKLDWTAFVEAAKQLERGGLTGGDSAGLQRERDVFENGPSRLTGSDRGGRAFGVPGEWEEVSD